MKNTMKTLVVGLITAILVGCQTAPMTVKSRPSVDGAAVVTEEVTTILPDGRKTTVVKTTTKSPAAVGLEVTNGEFKGRTQVGTAEATMGWRPYSSSGGDYGGNWGGGGNWGSQGTSLQGRPYQYQY